MKMNLTLNELLPGAPGSKTSIEVRPRITASPSMTSPSSSRSSSQRWRRRRRRRRRGHRWRRPPRPWRPPRLGLRRPPARRPSCKRRWRRRMSPRTSPPWTRPIKRTWPETRKKVSMDRGAREQVILISEISNFKFRLCPIILVSERKCCRFFTNSVLAHR